MKRDVHLTSAAARCSLCEWQSTERITATADAELHTQATGHPTVVKELRFLSFGTWPTRIAKEKRAELIRDLATTAVAESRAAHSHSHPDREEAL